MKFLHNTLLIAMLLNTGFTYAARSGAAQPKQTTARPTTTKKAAAPAKSKGKTTTQVAQQPSTQQRYTQILNTIRTTTPSTADYQTLINIKNEVENQIQQVEQAKIDAETTMPNQQPLPQQKNSQSRVAMRESRSEGPWWARDMFWIEENWDSLTQQEKMELYNENPSGAKSVATFNGTPFGDKLRLWLTKNNIPFERLW